jgi:hypothetical protein
MTEYKTLICGERVPDDGLWIDIGPVGGDAGATAWYEMPLPQCPDCGGDLVWYEAGHGPETRKCMGSLNRTGAHDPDGGCGSLFRVDCEGGRVILRRERLP